MKTQTRKQTQRRNRCLGALLLAAAAVPSALVAASSVTDVEEGWSIRVYAASIDFDRSGRAERPGYDLDIGFGFGLNAEYRLSRRLGVDVGILGGAAVDVAWSPEGPGEWVWAGYDTMVFRPLSAGLDIHLTPGKNVDLYLCPMVAWIHYGSLTIHSGAEWTATRIEFDDELAPGISLGLGVPIGERERWLFTTNLIYLESGLHSSGLSGGRAIGDYDATILGLGFGYRF